MFQQISLLCLSLLLSCGAIAQSTAPQTGKPASTAATKPANTPTNPPTKEAQARTQRGIDLLYEAGTEAVNLDDQEFAARLLAKIAEPLWKRLPEEASNFTRKAFEKALDYLQDNKPRVPAISPNRDLYLRYLLCQTVITSAKQHDAKLGEELAERFSILWARVREEKRKSGYLVSLNDSYLLDPRQAQAPQFPPGFDAPYLGFTRDFPTPQAWLAEAQRVYAASFPRNILDNLWYLADRDRALADQLFIFLLNRIEEDDTAGPLQLLYLAPYPFGDHLQSITDGQSPGMGHDYYGIVPSREPRLRPPALQRDEWLIYRFLQTAFIVLQRTASNDLAEFPNVQSRLGAGLFLAGWLKPRIAALQPQQLPVLDVIKRTLANRVPLAQQENINRTLGYSAQLWNSRWEGEYRRDWPDQKPAVEADPVDMLKALISRAEREAAPAMHDYIYQEAAQLADHEGKSDSALALSDKIMNLDYRQAVREWLSFNAAKVAIANRQYEDAERLAESVKAADQHTYILCQIAEDLVRRQRDRAQRLLNDGDTQARNAYSSAERVRALWLLTNSYLAFDQPRALEELNELVQAVSKLADFKWTDLSITRTLNHPAGWPRTTTETLKALQWEQPFVTLARTNFEDVLGQIQAMENKPLKLVALAGVAPLLFEPTKATPPATAAPPSNQGSNPKWQ